VLGNLSGDDRHLYQTPHKYVLVAPEEVDELAFIFRVQAGPDLNGFGSVLVSICMALASSAALNALDEGGMAWPRGTDGIQRLNSLNSATMTAATTNSMLSSL
jgi:hypothetical protein